jgi:hypothetical protein
MADIKNGAVTIEGLSELDKKLAQLKTDSPGFERRLRGVIRKILGHARANLRKDAAEGLQMENDPRHAYKAIRFAVYKKIFGGQVNILNSRKAGAETNYKPERKGTSDEYGRGGNRRTRVSRSLDKYEGVDRGFILRWLNNGMTKTNPRVIKFTDNPRRKVDKWNKHPNTGNRGAIAARNWFRGASLQEMQTVAGEMQQLIDKIIKEEFI